jgi:hypothetical protein
VPLAWGAKAHAGKGDQDPFFLQAAEGQGTFACLDWYSGFRFSWEVTMTQDVVTRFESHTALAEIDPNPESEADVVKIQPVFFILIEIIGR